MRTSTVSQSSVSIPHDVRWIEEVTSLVTQQMVHQCTSTYEQGHLLSLLAKSMFGRNFSFKSKYVTVRFLMEHGTAIWQMCLYTERH